MYFIHEPKKIKKISSSIKMLFDQNDEQSYIVRIAIFRNFFFFKSAVKNANFIDLQLNYCIFLIISCRNIAKKIVNLLLGREEE